MGLTWMFVKAWLAAQTSRFVKEERGAADIIAIVLVIAVVIALALVFKEEIMTLLRALFPSDGADVQDSLRST